MKDTPEVITISDSENEEKENEVITISDSENEEKYLKIYYSNSSAKCLEVPFADDGKLLMSDIKNLNSNVSALNLMNDEVSRLLKPNNGCFKEPPEGWSKFKIFAVLNDLRTSTISSNNNVSTQKISIDKFRRVANEIPPTVTTSSKAGNATAAKEQNTVPPLQRIDPSPPTSYVHLIDISSNRNKRFLSPYSIVAGLLQFQILLPGESSTKQIKKEACDSTLKCNGEEIESTSESTEIIDLPFVQSINTSSNANKSFDDNMSEVTNAQIFQAFNVTSIEQLGQLLCQGNSKFNKCFNDVFGKLRSTMIAHPDKDFVILIYYAYQSSIDLSKLDPYAPEFCEICDKHFTISHLVSKEHIMKYRSKYNKDPPEISLIFDLKNRAHIVTPAILTKSGENVYNYFINKFYPKTEFKIIKHHLANRITGAHLKLPFEDPLLFEKLLFLKNAKHHSNVKNIFSTDMTCKDCDKNLQSSSDIVRHIMSTKHLRKHLTQNELDKLIEAVSAIDYSDDGFFYNSTKENRKRNHQESSDTTTAAKRQKKD